MASTPSDQTISVMPIAELWDSKDPDTWFGVLQRYCDFVRPENVAIERYLEMRDIGEPSDFLTRNQWHAR
jgi:hypothetical protein